MFANLTLFALTFSLILSAQSDDGKKLVTLRDFSVQGSRFSTVSVVRLAGLHTGKQVNFLLLNDALQKVVSSGLIENIDFEYENYEDKPEEVKLVMKCRYHPDRAVANRDRWGGGRCHLEVAAKRRSAVHA